MEMEWGFEVGHGGLLEELVQTRATGGKLRRDPAATRVPGRRVMHLVARCELPRKVRSLSPRQQHVESQPARRGGARGELRLQVVKPGIRVEVPDPGGLYLYTQRLLIVWEFDEDGLVLCEDSYSGGGPGFEGIAGRPIRPEQIYRVGPADGA